MDKKCMQKAKIKCKKDKMYVSKVAIEFMPSKIKITDQGGMEYEIIEMQTRLTKLNFESKKGKTVLFFIFGDEFNPEVGWKNSKKKTFKARLLDSHPQSVYKIQLEARGPAKAGKP